MDQIEKVVKPSESQRTALDDVEETTLGLRSNASHFTARDEVKALIDSLKLPMDERGKRRAAARAEWAASEIR